MKKRLLIILFILLLCGCSNQKNNSSNNPDEKLDPIEEKLNSMTIEEKIGQMLIIRAQSLTVDGDYLELLNKLKPGGIIISGGNIDTFEQTKKFIQDVKNTSDIPMIISIDEEGGSIQKLKEIKDKKILSIPSMYEVGQTKDTNYAFDVGKAMARELKTIGVNVTYAPVLDIYNPNNEVIGKRSFGDKETISSMAISVAKGIESEGIIPTYKHFPGHGDTETDSHNELPIINKTYDELKENDLVPFKDAIANNAQIIMVGHLSFPNITGDNTPASLSHQIVTDILKNELNYQGLVITDALDMGALINTYSDSHIAIMAINAGVDLLLMPRDLDNIVDNIKVFVAEERINESVRKILTFKERYLKDYELLDESYLNNEEQQKLLNNLTNK